MKFLLPLVFAAGVAGSANAANPWPLPSPVPVVAPSETATTPAPRVEWLQRVWTNFDKTRKNAGAVDFVLDGDSITDGWQGPGKEVFAKHFGDRRSLDFAISGDRTEHVLWRLSQGQVQGLAPKLVAIMIGTNNLRSNTDEQIVEGVKAIVKNYRKLCPKAVILLQGIFPRGASASDPLRARIKAINSSLSKLGSDDHVIYIDFGEKFLQPDGSLSREIMPDFLHPSAKGYEIWAEAIQAIVDKHVPAR